MATTVLTSQNPDIVSKGTFTLNVRIKKKISASNEIEDQKNAHSKLDNNFLEGTSIPSKSNIQFSIQDYPYPVHQVKQDYPYPVHQVKQDYPYPVTHQVKQDYPYPVTHQVKKKITPIVKKETTPKKKALTVVKKKITADKFELNLNQPEAEPIELDNINIIQEIMAENNTVKKRRIMGQYFYVSVKKPYYIYCLKDLDKIGMIRENREIIWYE